jgi:hypothetical protein
MARQRAEAPQGKKSVLFLFSLQILSKTFLILRRAARHS